MYWVFLRLQLIDMKIGNENQLIAISKPISRAFLGQLNCSFSKITIHWCHF